MALQGGAEDVYATLLLNDSYLPGALVLARSLRDAGTTKKLAVLVTLDTVSAEVITELKAVFDHVIPVTRIQNKASSANLDLMQRPDLHSAFTKIYLWKLAQFRKIVYIDADVVAYRAPDELFDLPQAFAAAPDIGWPDLFNTGVMVITPDVGEFFALLALAERGVSFDGADQGLLNMHFKDSYHRLPFTYNVTPSAHYQYLPAYRHFQANITMVHFIGPNKPWVQGRGASSGSTAYDEMVGQWWAVYDRHYHKTTPQLESAAREPSKLVQYFVKGEFQPTVTYRLTTDQPSLDLGSSSYGQHSETLPPQPSSHTFYAFRHHTPAPPSPPPSSPPPHVSHESEYRQSGPQSEPSVPDRHVHYETGGQEEEHAHDHQPDRSHAYDHEQQHHHHHHRHEGDSQHGDFLPPPASSFEHDTSFSPLNASFVLSAGHADAETSKDQVPGHERETSQPPAPEHKHEPPQPSTEPSWDAQWQPPPVNAKPEAMNFPQAHYEMSQDTAPFVPPARYPSPPRDMWYDVPDKTPDFASQRLAPIFPWENQQPAPTRVFNEPAPPSQSESTTSEASTAHSGQWGSQSQQPLHVPGAEPSMTTGSPSVDLRTEPATPTTPTNARVYPPSDPWGTFTRSNAWDDVPQIERYVDVYQRQHHVQPPRIRTRAPAPGTLRLSGAEGVIGSGIGGGDGTYSFSDRRGSKITDFPSEVERPSLPVTPAPIRRPKFWGGGGPGFGANEDEYGGGDHLLPAAEGVPQQADWDPIAQLQKLAKQQSDMLLLKLGKADEAMEGGAKQGRTIPSRPLPYGSDDIRSPTYVAQTAAPVVSPKPLKPNGMETQSVRNIYTTGGDGAGGNVEPTTLGIEEPSYHGPGIVFEKDEEVFEHGTTAALPSEEEKDVLLT